MVTTTIPVYDIINRIIQDSRNAGHEDIAKKLDSAMHLGSSGLEIIGAIKTVLETNRNEIEKFATKSEINGIIDFARRAYTE